MLSAPILYPLTQTSALIKDRLVYVIRHYGNIGISVLISKQKDVKGKKVDPDKDILVLCGDWRGNSLDLADRTSSPLTEHALKFVRNDIGLFLQMMKTIRLEQAQFFLALSPDGLILVDMQVAVTKLVGPGMLRDIFGKVYRTQEVLKVEPFDARALEYIQKGTGNYEGNVIVKLSKFSLFSPTKDLSVPLYTGIER